MSEVRPIDANALSEWIDESVRQYGNQYSTDMLNMFGLFKEVINKAPTVEQKHTLNDSICNIRSVCKSNNVCVDCPMNYNCKEEPARWEVIKNETNN